MNILELDERIEERKDISPLSVSLSPRMVWRVFVHVEVSWRARNFDCLVSFLDLEYDAKIIIFS